MRSDQLGTCGDGWGRNYGSACKVSGFSSEFLITGEFLMFSFYMNTTIYMANYGIACKVSAQCSKALRVMDF